jgi:predicted dehydrogenase
VLNFRANMFHSSYLDTNRPMSWRLRKAESGGGVFADLGAHLVDLMRVLLGNVGSLRAQTRTYITDRPVKKGEAQRSEVDVDDWALATLELESGSAGVIEVTRMAAGAAEDTSIQIFGSQGALAFHMAHPEMVQYYDLKTQKWMSGLVPLAALSNGRPNEKLWAPPKFSQGMMTNVHLASQYDLLQSIVEGTPTWLSFDEGAAVQEVVEGVYLSAARGGERVDLPI